MKAVKVGEYQLDVIVESDKYIDIYTYYDYYEDNSVYLDNGKGWRLNELHRLDLKTGIIYHLTSEPDRHSFAGYMDYELKYKKGDTNYSRLLIINYTSYNNPIGYVTQDICKKEWTVPLTDEIRKKYNIDPNVIYTSRGNIKVEDNKCTFYEQYEQIDAFDETLNDSYKVNNYIFNTLNDYENTNTLFQDYYNFSKSYYVFGIEGEEPRVVKLKGNDNASYSFKKRPNGVTKVLCKNPNKYVKQNIPTWYIKG